ncbi:MarR family winged helix-turn-helix transcriptional regulator [Nitrospirillum iridis]|uniref:MarR family transcriptional regulator for hemolysin n=1 Tax=Nitrospirillum iridis TaxID=765888 RepID=A0A7X0B086_9PROT|nr:MarR family transcriptional regulator [Nitrospirillum iridis]MBB6253358.1 MarR family transcriptional regulator for hemolysin [Nitrospirillum iridis]
MSNEPFPGRGFGIRRDLSIKIIVMARTLKKRFDQRVADLGVTRSQWTLIAAVARFPGMTQRTIAEALEITEASAGRLIDKLCQEGMLRRTPRNDDRRAYNVEITEGTRPLLDHLGTVAERLEYETFAGLSDAELAQLSVLLGKIAHNVADTWPTGPLHPDDLSET